MFRRVNVYARQQRIPSILLSATRCHMHASMLHHANAHKAGGESVGWLYPVTRSHSLSHTTTTLRQTHQPSLSQAPRKNFRDSISTKIPRLPFLTLVVIATWPSRIAVPLPRQSATPHKKSDRLSLPADHLCRLVLSHTSGGFAPICISIRRVILVGATRVSAIACSAAPEFPAMLIINAYFFPRRAAPT